MIRFFRNFIPIVISFASFFAIFSCNKSSTELTAIFFTNVKDGEVTIGVGNDFRLKYILEPYGIEDLVKLEWTSSKKNVATVRNGRVTAVEPGTTIITASSGSVSASVKVNVEILDVNDFSLPETVFAYVGRQVRVDVDILDPEDATAEGIEWSVTNEGIATCEIKDGQLYITAHADGSTVLTGKASGSDKIRSCTIQTATYIPVQTISVTMDSLSISAGKDVPVKLHVLPENASMKDVTWSVSPEDMATFDESAMLLRLGLKTGIVTLTATSVEDQVSGSAKLTVTDAVGLFYPQDAPDGFICPDGSFEAYPKSIKMVPCFPSSVSAQPVTWKSYDTSRATVDQDGVVTAVGHGAVLIEAVAGKVTIRKVVRSFKESMIDWRAYTPESRNWDDYVKSKHVELTTIGMAGNTAFWVIDKAAWYKTASGKEDIDKEFYPKVYGRYTLPQVSSTTSNIKVTVLDQMPRLVECKPSKVASGDVTVDMGIGKAITMKMEARVKTISFVESLNNDESCVTIANGGTHTFSKSRDGDNSGLGFDHVFYANYSDKYDNQHLASRRVILDCSPKKHNFGLYDEYLLWNSKSSPEPGTYKFTFRSHPDGFDPGTISFTFIIIE